MSFCKNALTHLMVVLTTSSAVMAATKAKPHKALTPAVSAEEANCTPKDYRPILGEPRDQDPTGWCFAHTTADLASVALKTRVSAFDVADQYIMRQQAQLLAVKDPRIQAFLKSYKPVTPGAKNFMDDWKYYRTQDASSYSARKFLTDDGVYNIGGSEQVALITAQILNGGYCRDVVNDANGDAFFKERLSYARDIYDSLNDSTDMSGKATNFTQIVTDAAPDDLKGKDVRLLKMAYAIDHVNDVYCAGNTVKPAKALLPEFYMGASDLNTLEKTCLRGQPCRAKLRDQMFQHIDKALNTGRVVSIGYAYNDFGTDDADTLKLVGNTPEETEALREASNDHASIIAARRFSGGQCQYFVRNSFGKDCSIYRPEYKNNCEQQAGGVWIPKEDFKSIYSVIMVTQDSTNTGKK